MSETISWQIPPSVLSWLDRIHTDKSVVILIRHSVRPPLAQFESGYDLSLTDKGQSIANDLGRLIGRRLKSLHTSPILRCVQTAHALDNGAGSGIAVKTDRLLGDPGVYVLDGNAAITNWEKLRHEGVMANLTSDGNALPGMAHPNSAARYLVSHMLAVSQGIPGLHVFVTHDSLITATVAQLARKSLGKEYWPWYLEAAFIWQDYGVIRLGYREIEATHPLPLCNLTEQDILEFARREVTAVLGSNCGARFFLAGGAFKSLLTGHSPRDLDIWAPTLGDRERIVEVMLERGAQLKAHNPYNDCYLIADRIVEIPLKNDPPSLEERLARFDIGISGVGVEFSPPDTWRVVILPEAIESARTKKLNLIGDMVRGNHILSTLVRLRNYSRELGYQIPRECEVKIWDSFQQADFAIRQRIIKNFRKSSHYDPYIEREALCLSR